MRPWCEGEPVSLVSFRRRRGRCSCIASKRHLPEEAVFRGSAAGFHQGRPRLAVVQPDSATSACARRRQSEEAGHWRRGFAAPGAARPRHGRRAFAGYSNRIEQGDPSRSSLAARPAVGVATRHVPSALLGERPQLLSASERASPWPSRPRARFEPVVVGAAARVAAGSKSSAYVAPGFRAPAGRRRRSRAGQRRAASPPSRRVLRAYAHGASQNRWLAALWALTLIVGNAERGRIAKWEQSGGLQDDAGTEDACRAHEKSEQAGGEAI